MSVVCGKETFEGLPCRRRVASPGAPCGAQHREGAASGLFVVPPPRPETGAVLNDGGLVSLESLSGFAEVVAPESPPGPGPEELARQVRSDDLDVALSAACHPRTPPEAVEWFVRVATRAGRADLAQRVKRSHAQAS